uniref:SET domain-containing protein n=1 Tax=Chromera velia CCMP2878 TaxID=1169474 RepID=A0A0G4HAJ4_9ALVE|eukprot:Cvel_6050.t1-p1 / transcript=Cvel_6050.t1 / gene=Cvel_6050 / organism=Chromera_velia_CCMP2878 / gene_product=hypothetical protein / transcript_product=hypothetical protein / location=Cvel_scaffold290:100415-103957(-) / protein_length=731 / sequence_SO=supercontig / SO=protein_coding / is_pseudo=false
METRSAPAVFCVCIYICLSVLAGGEGNSAPLLPSAGGRFLGSSTECLFDWARLGGGVFDDLQPAIVSGGMRGVVATRRIPERAAGVKLVWNSATESIRLAVRLLRERRRGRASVFFPYVQALPRETELRGMMFGWKPEEALSLGDSVAIELNRQSVEELNSGFSLLSSGLNMKELVRPRGKMEETDEGREKALAFRKFDSCREVDGEKEKAEEGGRESGENGDRGDELPLEFSEFRWAMSAVFSRAFWLQGIKELFCLFPIADLPNHRGSSYGRTIVKTSRPQRKRSPANQNEREDDERDESSVDLVMQTTGGFEEGEEIVWAYGDRLSSRHLLWNYGFVEKDNPLDSLDIGPSLHVLSVVLSSYPHPLSLLRASAEHQQHLVGMRAGSCPRLNMLASSFSETLSHTEGLEYSPAKSSILGAYPTEVLLSEGGDRVGGKGGTGGPSGISAFLPLSSIVLWYAYGYAASRPNEGAFVKSRSQCRACSFFFPPHSDSPTRSSLRAARPTPKVSDWRCYVLSVLLEKSENREIARALASGEALGWPIAAVGGASETVSSMAPSTSLSLRILSSLSSEVLVLLLLLTMDVQTEQEMQMASSARKTPESSRHKSAAVVPLEESDEWGSFWHSLHVRSLRSSSVLSLLERVGEALRRSFWVKEKRREAGQPPDRFTDIPCFHLRGDIEADSEEDCLSAEVRTGARAFRFRMFVLAAQAVKAASSYQSHRLNSIPVGT